MIEGMINMRIMIIGPELSTHPKRWAIAMASRGHEVLLVSREDQKDQKRELPDNIKVIYLSHGGRLGYYLNVPEVKKICREYKPDIVNAHYASGNGTLARLSGVRPLVISCWGSDIFEYPYQNAINKYILKKNFKYADAIASTSKSMAEEARKVMGDPNLDITVTPFGVNPSVFYNKHLEKNKNRPVIGIVKYLKPIYDIELLIKAFAIVKQTTDAPVLHIYGDGPLRRKLEGMCTELGISDSVTFFGIVPNTEVPDILNTFDIFVNCSKRESFGVAVVEAMACELPVVVTQTSGYCEIVDNEVNGVILKDRNPHTMANTLLHLLRDDSERERLGRAGRQKVLEEYDWESNITIMEKLFESLIV